MAKNVEADRGYDDYTINSRNPLARFAHRSRNTRAISLVERHLPANGTLLDFGAGTGVFLASLGRRRPDVMLLAVEPYMTKTNEGKIRFVDGLEKVADASIDVLTAFETLEHLEDADLEDFVHQSRRVLRSGGKLIVSVPIMVGAAAAAKEVNQITFNKMGSEFSLLEVLKATIGISARPTPGVPRRLTHKGFDFRQLERRLSQDYTIESGFHSPFVGLPWFLNSQAFRVAAPKPPVIGR
jgi:2-polyprenyl-3-methyl-5-hydroxy-6-metoxy-1,4-benzoquinol methylase